MKNGRKSSRFKNREGIKVLEQVLTMVTEGSLANLPMIMSGLALFVSALLFIRISAFHKNVESEKEKLEKRLRIITSGAVGMGEKIVQLESRLADAVNGQLQAAELEAQFSYTQALKLIENGVDHSVVMSNSGLSESEVNLMELLHQAKRGVSHAS